MLFCIVISFLYSCMQALSQLEGRIEELNGQLESLKVAMPGLAGGSFGGMIKAA